MLFYYFYSILLSLFQYFIFSSIKFDEVYLLVKSKNIINMSKILQLIYLI
jgi:hypothetical protein